MKLKLSITGATRAAWSRRIAGLAVGTLVLVGGGPAPAGAGEPEVFYSAVGCTETVLLLPTAEFGPTAQVSLLVYRCERATIAGKTISPFLVSEIGVFDGGNQRLLRSVTNSRAVSQGLRRLGFNSVYSPSIDYSFPTDGVGPISATVEFKNGQYSFHGTAGASPLAASDGDGPGATYRNTDQDGNPIVLEYDFTNVEPVPGVAAASVDAEGDPQLAEWLSGRTSMAGGGVQAKGDWDGSGRRGG